ncbi:NADH-quinone oxidoreductase subunit J [Aeromicrobium chenweiae]|uniref:NADH-quinone oxidoreductase subunit J n=1 Tax=Aeromicrobium chenweiae TaxID=2079793 RepID=A0A2S0WQ74_9ACTN|nr:NADH-quinone oxidoreductase subunit J [Aeromicrobium chenweiae]AWB93513.1 NADH-quinone oxidoreductase subunit J [Aeromicrobium chenweiae]TGN34506.1 NADH-quinone oxidoreductase subunit J [Aeromicrobium chenweiae]
MTTFWLLAPIMVIAALGLLFARKAVHAALALAVVMISLAVLYAAQGAPFLFAVQIIVYTGAIMMLFLFVLMLVGVETSEAIRETISGQRAAAILIGLLFGVTAVLAIGQTVTGAVVGLDSANANGNPYGLAKLLFGKYVVAFEFTSALLITAALGAMVLAHKERLTKRHTQADIAARRMREYAESGRHPGNAPTPGVFARHNAVDTPALLPDGTPVESSVSPTIAERGQIRSGFEDNVARTAEQLEHEDDPDSSAPGMGGPK